MASAFSVTEGTDGKKLANALRKLAVADNPDVVEQIVSLVAELSVLETEIQTRESAMNTLICSLYGLTNDEKALVTSG